MASCCLHPVMVSCDPLFFFFNDTATTEIYTLSLHDALPIYAPSSQRRFPMPFSMIPISAGVVSLGIILFGLAAFSAFCAFRFAAGRLEAFGPMRKWLA